MIVQIKRCVKYIDEDRETISNEIVGLHTRIDANIDECKQCIRNINILDTELTNIKKDLNSNKSTRHTIYFLSGVCAVQAATYLLPILKKIVKK